MRQADNAVSNLPPPTDGSHHAGDFTQFSPWRFLMVTIGGIFLAELFAMFVLLNFRTWPYPLQALLDATLMVLLIFPLIYYFSLRPLLMQIEKRQRAETDLKSAYEEMELHVQKRTEELRVVNFDLEEEINVRTQAENALRQSEQRLSRAQEIAHLGSWELDLLTDQLTWSDEVYRIFGLQPQEFGATYEAFLEAIHPDDRAAVDESYSGSIRGARDMYEIEHRIVRPLTGEVRTVHEKCEHFRDTNGQIIRSVGMVHDITERKQAEEVLRRFELMSEHSRDIILFINLHDGHILEANTAAALAYGYSRDEMLTLTIGDLRDPLTRELTAEQMAQADAGGILFETVHQRKDGNTFPVEVSSQGATVNGKRTLISIVRDITERKQAEEDLLQSEEKYRLLADNANDWIYWIKPNGSFQYVSPSCEGITGFSALEFMENPGLIIDTLHPEDRKLVELHFSQVVEGDETHHLDYRILTKTNEVRWISHSCDPVNTPDGNYRGRSGTNRDITERKRAEEALRESEEKFHSAFAHAAIGFAMTTPDGYFIDANPAYCALTGYGIDELQTMEFSNIIDPDDRAANMQLIDHMLSGQFNDFVLENRYLRKNGKKVWVRKSISLVREVNGSPQLIIALVEDITERKQAEEALRRSEALLRQTGEIAKVGGWDLDLQTMSLQWSLETYRIHEVDPALQLNVETAVNYYMPEVRAVIRAAVEYATKSGQPYDLELPLVTAKGRDIWIRTQGQPEFDDGKCVRIFGTFQDITERKQSEEALRIASDELELRVLERTEELAATNKELVKEIAEREKIERQLRIQTTAMKAAANGIVITDRQGKIEWTNPALTQIAGYEIHELLGQGMRLFQSGKHDAGFYKQLWETILAGDVWRGEMINRRKDGNLYIEEQTITPVRDGNGQISHFIAIKRDVTERNLMYAQLEESNRQLTALSMLEQQQRKVAETLSQASVALSETLDVQHVMETILDYVEMVLPVDAAFLALSEGDDQYRIRGVRASKDQGQVMNLLNQSIDLLNEPTVKPFFERETSTRLRDSQRIEVWNPPVELTDMRSWLGIPLISTGKTMGMVVAANLQADFFTDGQVELAEAVVSQATVALQNAWLFEQVRAGRQRLQMLSRHLVEIQENERKFIARELHDETSQSLTSLKLGLHSIEQITDSESMIGKQITHLKTLADEILESLHRLAINLRPASLDHLGLVEALTGLVQSTGERSQLIARFKCLGTDHRTRLTEDLKSSVYRIVQESLTNIVRHARATCADVILEWQDDQIMIIVEDDGIGIDLTSARASGRLGLVGMQERAEMLGGTLLIESNPNAGTTLVVEIPYAH